jgi:hypothetical protein
MWITAKTLLEDEDSLRDVAFGLPVMLSAISEVGTDEAENDRPHEQLQPAARAQFRQRTGSSRVTVPSVSDEWRLMLGHTAGITRKQAAGVVRLPASGRITC